MEALLEPIKQRWRFHFEGERATNRLDKVRRVQQAFFVSKERSDELTFISLVRSVAARMALHSPPQPSS